MYKTLFQITLYSLFSITLQSQNPIGIWITVDDETGKEKSHVEVYEKDQKLFGKIIKLLLKPQNTVCEVCDGERKNKPLVGMVIISNMKKVATSGKVAKYTKRTLGKSIMDF